MAKTDDQVPVLVEDREAAAELCAAEDGERNSWFYRLRGGKLDGSFAVQAFARHAAPYRARIAELEGERDRGKRLRLVKSTCEVRDARWRIHIDADDDPCSVRVVHRQYGDYYDWPDAAHGGGGCVGGVCPGADRAYIMQDESNFRTRSEALKAGHEFLRRFGAGEVEYLEWDVDSQSMIVVGHNERRSMVGWYKHWDDKPDPLAPFYAALTPEAKEDSRG